MYPHHRHHTRLPASTSPQSSVAFVPCNHYDGEPEDEGTRTDLAVVRMAKLERAFFDEAPRAPLRVVSTNDGNNFPLNMVLQATAEVGHKEASCGVNATKWLLSCGAHVAAIGIGHNPDGTWASAKFYPDGTKDSTTHCDWETSIAVGNAR